LVRRHRGPASAGLGASFFHDPKLRSEVISYGSVNTSDVGLRSLPWGYHVMNRRLIAVQ
jgi:hypothetical protein